MREWLAVVVLALVLGSAPARAAPPPPPPEEEAPETDETAEDESAVAPTPVAAPVVGTEVKEPPPAGYQEVPGSPETQTEGDLRVTVETGALRPARGYLPVQVTLQSLGRSPREVRLEAESSGGSRGGSTTRQVELGAHQRLVTWLPVPVTGSAGLVRVQSPGVSMRVFSYYSAPPSGQPLLVLGSEKAFVEGTRMERSDKRPRVSVRFIPLEDAPRELAAYVGASPIVVAGEVTALSAEAWSALEAYAATGGLLVLLKPPRDVARRLPLLAERTSGDPLLYGFGQVLLCNGAQACGTTLLEHVGFPANGQPAHEGLLSPAGPAPRWQGRGQLNDGAQPLLPGVRAPVGRFMLLITLFVLAVGPGGLLLARRKGPVALLVAVPSVALLTCLCIVAWSVLVEGFSVHAARYSFIWLDRERDRVLVAGVGGYYANLEPRGLQLPVLGVLLSPDLEWDAQTLDADWTQGMVVAGGFLPSRTYREWGELAVVPSRARLVVRREGAGYRAQNALGAELRSGCVRLGDQLWSVPALADGAEGELRILPGLSEAAIADLPSEARDRFSGGAWGVLQSKLPEGGFLARLGGAGLGPTTALAVELERGEHILRGRVDAP